MGRGAQDPVAEFADAVFRHAVRRLAAQGVPHMDADDIAAALAERVVTAPERILGRYPSPAAYVKAALRTARIDHDRAQRRQRNEGSRPVLGDDQDVTPRRTVLSLEAMAGGHAWVTKRNLLEWEDDLVTAMDINVRVAGLDPTTVAIGQAVAAGFTVREAAGRFGCSLDQANRRLRATRNHHLAVAS